MEAVIKYLWSAPISMYLFYNGFQNRIHCFAVNACEFGDSMFACYMKSQPPGRSQSRHSQSSELRWGAGEGGREGRNPGIKAQ